MEIYKNIFDETQADRDREVARYLGVTLDKVRVCKIVSRFGPPIYKGKDFKSKSYDHLYKNFGKKAKRVEIIKTFAQFNIVKRRYLIDGLLEHVPKRWAPKGRKALDFGCGPGGHAVHYLQRGARVDLLDVDCPLYAFAKWRVKDRGLKQSAKFLRTDTDLRAKRYDLILCIDVLEHVANPYKELRRLVRALKPGGFMILQFGGLINPRQGHFKQSKNVWKSKRCQGVLKSLTKLGDFWYAR